MKTFFHAIAHVIALLVAWVVGALAGLAQALNSSRPEVPLSRHHRRLKEQLARNVHPARTLRILATILSPHFWAFVFYAERVRLTRLYNAAHPGLSAEEIAELTEQMRAVVSPLEDKLRSLQDELDRLRDAGERPDSPKVQDLEARLIEVEENLRRTTARPSLPADPERRGENLFRGAFLRDLEEARKAFRTLFDPNTRAIDSSLFSSGGKLNPDQADAFIDFLIEKQTTLSRISVRRMMSPQGHTDELTVAARKIRLATEATAPSVANAVGTRRRTLTTVEVIWAEDITLTFLEDNIEKRGAETHIARLLATQFGNDLNDLGWNGDTAAGVGPDQAFLQVNDGWIKLFGADADVNDFDATGATAVSAVLKGMHKLLPVEFKGRTDLAYFVPVGTAEEYANEVSKRETGLGDGVLVNGFPALRYFGRPVIPEPHLQGDNAVLTPASNLFFGIQRSMTVDSEWVPRKRVIEYTLTARIDYEYANGKAVTLADNIPAALR